MNATSILKTFTVRNDKLPWIEAPTLIHAGDSELVPIGTARARRYFTFARYPSAEFVAGRLLTDADELPNRLLVVGEDADGARTYLPLSPVPVGTFEAASTAAPVRPPKPSLPVDSMGRMFLAPSKSRPGAPPARGAEAIIERLASKGASVALSTDGTALVVTSAGGRAGPGVAELLAAAQPLLVLFLRDGKTPPCTVRVHKVPQPSVTVTLGGAFACPECLGGAK